MTTISGQTAGTTPLSGAEVLPADITLGGVTERFTTADVARLAELYAAINNARPERIDALGAHFTTQGAGDPKTVWFAPPIVTESGYGPVAQYTGGGQVISRWPVTRTAARIYEVHAEVEQVSVGSGESPIARLGLYSLKSDYTSTTSIVAWGPASAILTVGSVTTLTQRFAATAAPGVDVAAWADDATSVWFRPAVQANYKSDLTGPTSSSVANIRRLLIMDVTPLVNNLARLKGRRRLNGGLV